MKRYLALLFLSASVCAQPVEPEPVTCNYPKQGDPNTMTSAQLQSDHCKAAVSAAGHMWVGTDLQMDGYQASSIQRIALGNACKTYGLALKAALKTRFGITAVCTQPNDLSCVTPPIP